MSNDQGDVRSAVSRARLLMARQSSAVGEAAAWRVSGSSCIGDTHSSSTALHITSLHCTALHCPALINTALHCALLSAVVGLCLASRGQYGSDWGRRFVLCEGCSVNVKRAVCNVQFVV